MKRDKNYKNICKLKSKWEYTNKIKKKESTL